MLKIKYFISKQILKIIKSLVLEINGIKTLDELKRRGLNIGQNVTILNSVYLDPSHCWLINIGNNVTIAPNAKIFVHDTSAKHLIGYTKISPVFVGCNTFIGANALILPGSRIGKNCILGAGSIFKGVLEDNMCFYGNKMNNSLETIGLRDKLLAELKNSRVFGIDYTYPNITKCKKSLMIEYLDKNKYAFIP